MFNIYGTFIQFNRLSRHKKQTNKIFTDDTRQDRFSVHQMSQSPLDPPLTKADRFRLVFRVSIMSSTIWNRLQCRGNVNKDSASAAARYIFPLRAPEDGSMELPILAPNQGHRVSWKPFDSGWWPLLGTSSKNKIKDVVKSQPTAVELFCYHLVVTPVL